GHAGTKPTLDYDAQESARGFSISTTIAPIVWKNTRLNVLDAPCYPDFVGDAYAAMSACETALFVVDAASGPGTITTRLWYAAEELSLARAVFVNRFDRTESDFDTVLSELRDRFGNRLGAVTLPNGVGDQFHGIIDVVHMKARHLEGGKVVEEDIPADMLDAAQAAREALIDLVAEADEDIMMKYLDGEEVTQVELEGCLGQAIRDRIFVPVFSGVSVQEEGITSLLNAAVAWFPTLTDFGPVPTVNGKTIDIDPDDKRPVAFVFKSLNDAQKGRLSFLKVLAGTLTTGIELTNARTRKSERLGHLNYMMGSETEEVDSVAAGDICVVPKLEALTGDTLSATGKVEAAAFRFPNSLYRI
ncbi:MAG TPA: GTP-binding protein, partial [Atopobiaceae bacterium]|nr:GTP-binding protein [Atopobiaceae bacterium]